ncbi:sugar ABC transporter permease [Pontibacillus halophilus JSM 076056 = DSM 19796]|uniref:Sugar ABC transporter permease n=1 Tax=Pontibacillus halophilus JSM 076056 = DSM 19796 TaxID=1385510 RepID=A0A0A5GHL3_9BACI|nr:carbohydrate ABC transporter permease [Pontibacillus halophilus]KGX92756.1 sugar ABC transporter permease [Pontibacillus halophilus JSM 076056 = DSM 19796]
MKPNRTWLKPLLYTILIGYSIVTFLPFLWAMLSSFKPLSEIVGSGFTFFPKEFTVSNYVEMFEKEPLFLRWMLNSIIVTVCMVGLNLLFNSMAGYALARIEFFGKKFWFFLVLAVLMIPMQVTMIPSFLVLRALGWLNTYQGLIIPGAINATFIFMMRQFFLNFPKELEEAAQMDGLSKIGTFFRIVLPLAKPALAAQAIFTFMGGWNDFMRPLIVMSDPEMFTLTLGLNAFKGQYISFWNYIMAASTIMTIPTLIIYAFFNRFFVQGITYTGGK